MSPTPKRDLRLLAGSAFLSSAGDMIAIITLALAVHDLTASGLAVSAYFAMTMLPVVAVAPLAGRLADRRESVHIMGAASIAQAAIAVGLAFSTGSLAAILALTALLAVGSAISQPAEFALVPALAKDGQLTRANGIMEAARYAGYAGGPLIAALLIAAGDATLALLVNAASFLAIAVAARMIRARRHGAAGAATAGPSEERRGGIALVITDPVLRSTVVPAIAALFVISGSITAEVFYVKDVIGAGDAAYALLMVAWMVALVAGAAGLAHRIPAKYAALAALTALGVQGLGMGGQTITVTLPAAFAGYLIGGLGHGVKNTLLRTLIQQRVPDDAHGRAFSAYNAARNAAEIAALTAGGLLVTAVGARAALAVAGSGALLAALAGLLVLLRGRTTAVRAVSTNQPVTEVP